MRKVFQNVIVQYKGQPTISVAVDGIAILSDIQLPNHETLLKRNIQLPANAIGEHAQLTTEYQGALIYDFIELSEQQFMQMQLFQFYEVKISGQVQVELYLDGVQLNPNNGADNSITITPRTGRTEDTRRVYFPPLSFGYVPQLKQNILSSNSGQVLYAIPKALPPRFYKGLREHSQVQVTHQGAVNVNVYLDGNLLSEYPLTGGEKGYVTTQEYLPAGSKGNIIQWIQSDSNLITSGEIALFETNTTLTDRDQPQQET